MPAVAWAALGLVVSVLGGLFHHTSACPAVVAYTAEQEKALASAVAALPPTDPLVGMTADYLALRKNVRACAGAK